jgi:hypothetical protein
MHGYSMLRYDVRAKFPGLAVGTRSPLATPLFSDHHRGGYDIDDMRMLGIGRNEMVPAVDISWRSTVSALFAGASS